MSVFARRRARLREVLVGAGLEALVVSHLPNVRYLTGYVGSNAIMVIGRAGERVLTDSRYAVSAREQVDDDVEVAIGPGDLTGDLARAVAEIAPGGRVGLEAAHLSMARGAQITARIGEADAGVAVSAEVGHVEGLRLIKDDQEIAAIARAADMVDDALADVLAGGSGRPQRARGGLRAADAAV